MWFNRNDQYKELLFEGERIPFLKIITIGLLPLKMKILFYKLLGYKIDWSVKIGFGSVIAAKKVCISRNVKIGHLVIIKCDELEILEFASVASFSYIDTGKLKMGSDSRIRENVMVGGIKTASSSLIVGNRCIIMQSSFLNTTCPIQIGDDSAIGGYSLIFTHGSWLSKLEGYPVTFAPVYIGTGVWLPWRVFIMPGVTIGNQVVVSANSVITSSLPANCLASGNPAKIIVKKFPRFITEEIRDKYFLEILEDFKSHLFAKGLDFELNQKTPTIVKLETLLPKKISLIWIKGEDYSICSLDEVNISIISTSKKAWINVRTGIILNLTTRQRFGEDAFGEVFVRFLSRYGIRFERVYEP